MKKNLEENEVLKSASFCFVFSVSILSVSADFADINEASPLVNQQRIEEEKTKKGCGCGPKRCCLL